MSITGVVILAHARWINQRARQEENRRWFGSEDIHSWLHEAAISVHQALLHGTVTTARPSLLILLLDSCFIYIFRSSGQAKVTSVSKTKEDYIDEAEEESASRETEEFNNEDSRPFSEIGMANTVVKTRNPDLQAIRGGTFVDVEDDTVRYF